MGESNESIGAAPRSVCLFCGSRCGDRPIYAALAARVGERLADLGIGLVTGGGRVGLMGAVADAALARGGRVVGVIPEALMLREVAHDSLSELHVVANMHQRKSLMARRADAFLTLPGGVGTYEEFFELLSWAFLGIHEKPLGVLNVEGYFDPLLAMLRHGQAEGFIHKSLDDLIVVSDDVREVIEGLVARMPRAAAVNDFSGT